MSHASASIHVDADDKPQVHVYPVGVAAKISQKWDTSTLFFSNVADALRWCREVVAQLDRLAAPDTGPDCPDPLDVLLDQAHGLADADDQRAAS